MNVDSSYMKIIQDLQEENEHLRMDADRFATVINEILQRANLMVEADDKEARRRQDEIIVRLCLDSGAITYSSEDRREKEGKRNEEVVRESIRGD